MCRDWCPIQGMSPPYTQCSQDRPWIHNDADQDKPFLKMNDLNI